MIITPLKNALLSLEDILKQPLNEYIRDGVIQRFEYTFELSWKIIARYFKEIGREDLPHGPRPLIKEAGKEGLINDVEAWLRFLESRNKSTHIYNDKEAQQVYEDAKNFPKYVKELIQHLEQKK
ncbi:MAG: HI0074 family nucleotidyltransferase substrate-binding subunit [Bacteriovoracaceae bacterium]|jgi:nucleotidyltransferase substrate binding protein (TIGR01987 family)|nr:HI0074 family nucleotidyltransferase substrate-binding subunit [Bacteriovoracaceae bacterium]|tara:strand:+ start:370 stop:741 length:372 start_codon:yes stop_codon:yes gene_type:complete